MSEQTEKSNYAEAAGVEISSPEQQIAVLTDQIEAQKARMDFTFSKRRIIRNLPCLIVTFFLLLILLFYAFFGFDDGYIPLLLGIFITILFLNLYSLITIVYCVVSDSVKKSRNADAQLKIISYSEQIQVLKDDISSSCIQKIASETSGSADLTTTDTFD